MQLPVIFSALLCACSGPTMSFLRPGKQNCTQYSKQDHNIALYKGIILLEILVSLPFLMIFSVAFVFFHCYCPLGQCFHQDFHYNPKLSVSVSATSYHTSIYLKSRSFVPVHIILYLTTGNFICHVAAYSPSLESSSCSSSQSVLAFTILCVI